MDQLKVAMFLDENKDFLFPNKAFSELTVENALIAAPDDFELCLSGIPLRKPKTVQIISFFVGSIGVDRFYLGEIGKGILKYFSFGGLGIWWIADIFSAKNRCRAYNCKKLISAINDPSVIAKMQNSDSKINEAVNTAKAFAPVVGELAKGAKNVRDSFFE